MKRFRIPPEIAWPMLVIALLLASVGTGISIVYFAHSDGGAQVVERTLPPQVDVEDPPADR